ncbi:MAG: rod shape-determining protein MreC [Pseudomonadota bacterium]
MKKIYSKKTKLSQTITSIALNNRASTVFLILISVIFLTLSILDPTKINPLRSTTTDIVSPVITFVSRPFEVIAQTITSVSGIASLRAENKSLQAENARLREWYQTALMLQAENQSLHKLLNVKIDNQHNYFTTRVISDVSNNFVKTIIINSGLSEGAKQNQAVLSGEGMIGRVIEPGQNTSRVLLLTDINSRLPVLIEGTNQKAILVGNNSDTPILRHLAKDAGIIAGSRIVTSGDGGIFPPNLPIGTIDRSLDGEVKVKLHSDIDNISFVRIVDTSLSKNLIRSQ